MMETEKPVGYFVVRQLSDRAEVHRIPSRHHEDSRAGERILSGILRNMDERFFVDWEDAS